MMGVMDGRAFAAARRRIGGLLLLAILAVCAYIGTGGKTDNAVSVAVMRTSYAPGTPQADSSQSAARRLQAQREEEIALLSSVAQSADASAQTKADALAQLAQLAKGMEAEAQVIACLAGMGIEPAAAVCGAQTMTVMIGYEQLTNEMDRTRVMDAVCSMTGFEPGDIKIILTKK